MFRSALDSFFGRGAAAVTVPSMDGALRPNSRLDTAAVVCELVAPDNLTPADGETLFTSGNAVYALPREGGAPQNRREFPYPVASMAWSSGTLAVGLPDGVRLFGGGFDGRVLSDFNGVVVRCPTAMTFERPGVLIVCLGSQTNPPDEWKRDLLQRNASGSVWRIDLAKNTTERVADGLAYPAGVSARDNGELWVSEAWAHRVLRLGAKGRTDRVIEHLPGYPCRLAKAADGGVWLCLFAPRRQMIEFVLREPAYLERMMAEVDPEYWMAPALSTGKSFLEPIQGGQVKHLGIVKPWGPTRSYGLVIQLDAAGLATASLHSRADGKRHGITSCAEIDGRLVIASKGGDTVIACDLATLERD